MAACAMPDHYCWECEGFGFVRAIASGADYLCPVCNGTGCRHIHTQWAQTSETVFERQCLDCGDVRIYDTVID